MKICTDLSDARSWLPFDLAPIMRYRAVSPIGPVARDPAKRIGYTSFRGYYKSLATSARWPFESLLERDALLVHDFDLGVRAFRAQPKTLTYRRQGRFRRYTPDLRVVLASGFVIYLEVRPVERTPGRLGPLLPWIEAACAEDGAAFSFIDEATIRAEPFYGNCRRYRAAAGHLTDEALLDAARVLLDVGLPAELGDLIAAGETVGRDVFLGLAALRVLRAPVGAPIDDRLVFDRGDLW